VCMMYFLIWEVNIEAPDCQIAIFADG
jgi:hypothetical protein